MEPVYVALPELVDYLAFAAAFVVGVAIGKRRERRKKPEPLTATCGCGHRFGFHEDGKRCYATDAWETKCTCRRYDGPDPAMFGLGSM